MRYYLLGCLFSFFIGNAAVAQDPSAVNSVTPPSPTAYNLGKYGMFKTGLYTGTMNAEIPLLEYKTPNLTIPVSLSYSSNGIRVEDVESRTGLVWNLNAGGVVIRNIKGKADVSTNLQTGSPYPEEVVDQLKLKRDADNGAPFLLQKYLLNASLPQGFDTEYDVFSYNFLQMKGKFIITSRGEVVQESQSALRIEVIGNVIDNGLIITDDKGIRYKFATTEVSQVSSGPDARNPPAITSWYLSEITHPKGDTVRFAYSRVVTNIGYTGEQSYTKINGFIDDYFAQFAASNSGYRQGLAPNNNIDGKRIAGITSNYDGNILFNNEIQNTGQAGDSLLTNIRYTNSSGRLLENIRLAYQQTTNKRVFLTNVTFMDTAKKYTLNYYSPDLFPLRTSFSQDYWGYYNGKSNQTMLPRDKDFDHDYPGITIYGDRGPDATYGVYGLLQKITYPTGGASLMQYEPNNYYTSRQQPSTQQVSLTSESGTSQAAEVGSSVMTPVGNQNITVFTTLSNSTIGGCPIPTDPDVIRRKGGQMRLYDMTTGANVKFDGNTNAVITITNGLGNRSYTVNILSGHQYKLYLTSFSCSKLQAVLSYTNGTQTIYYNDVTGGMRLKSIENQPVGGTSNFTYYRYTDTIGSDASSSVFLTNPPAFYSIQQKVFFTPGGCPCVPSAAPENQRTSDLIYLENKLSSNSLDFVFNQAGSVVGYRTVIESNDQNFVNGYTLHRHYTSIDGGGQIISVYAGTNVANRGVTNYAWNNGLEYYTAIYGKTGGNYVLFKEDSIYYEVAQIRSVPMILVEQRYSSPCLMNPPPPSPPEQPGAVCQPSSTQKCSCEGREFINTDNVPQNYYYGICKTNHRHSYYMDGSNVLKCSAKGFQNSIDSVLNPFYGKPFGYDGGFLNGIGFLNAVYYHFNSFLYHVSTQKEFIYSNGSKLTNTANYTYDNYNHVITTDIQNSKDQTVRTLNLYAVDYANTAVYDSMAARNMTGYVIKQTSSNTTLGKELSAVNNEYQLWNSNKFILPKQINKSYNGNPLVTEVAFPNYDSKNNNIEITPRTGAKETYLWGYNGQYPVAKVVGSNYTTVSSFVSQAILNNPATTDAAMRTELNKIRTGLAGSQALVYTYTYTPSVGLTSETDPAGKTTFYEYDSFGRLQRMRDLNGNIIKQFDYKYQATNQ